MPRSSVALTSEPLSGDAVVSAAGRLWTATAGADAEPLEVRVLDEGAVLQLVAGGEVVLSVLRPRMLPRLDEVERLLPDAEAPEGTQWWTDAYTPWQAEGTIGVAILDAAAEASRGIVVHQGLTPNRIPR
ncbi:hypothetical protein G5T42_06735 [Microbacterium sp. 4R-513]|uniref:hypothetical protein n=1 Tax=Microbacterium sp. 4R-513 TaxID=2567934 RepID=UPI0013E14894|nr:hypothetical protein [Microbacterium sp. 4R-513]QIG39218.1 hypothetical protein G5T42_06735 [Microbacterium sp. 4R-513]